MNGTMHKWLLKSLGSLSLASTVVLLPLLLTGCGESSTGTVTPVPPPPPPPPPAPPAPPPPPPTPVPAPTPTTAGPISALPTQLAALTPTGQVFSNPTVIPVGFGIRRANAAENIPVGVYTDYRAVLSFPIPDDIPSNAIVQGAQLTLVQLPSNDSATIPDFDDRGLGFFFLDPTPHNLPSNNVVFQEVTLGAPNNVVSTDFFAPASSPTFVALSINGNVLGNDVSAGPRTADVGPGVQRAVSGSRFYQVRLQCAKEVWNNQAAPDFVSVLATASASVAVDVSTVAIGALGSVILEGTLTVPADAAADAADVTAQVDAAAPATAALIVAGATTQAVFGSFTTTVSVSNALPGGGTVSASVPLTFGSFTQSAQLPSALVILDIDEAGFFSNIAAGTFSVTKPAGVALGAGETFTVSFGPRFAPPGFVALAAPVEANALVTASVSFNVTSPVSYEVSQGATGTCRAEFDREPATGTGAGPITTARGPRLDITFTIPR